MPTPAEADKTGAFYTFEKGATKTSGGQGFADVWFRDHFAWEYKRPSGDLTAAYVQLCGHVDDPANPPLLGCRHRAKVRGADWRPAHSLTDSNGSVTPARARAAH